jgi:hypothetical protein
MHTGKLKTTVLINAAYQRGQNYYASAVVVDAFQRNKLFRHAQERNELSLRTYVIITTSKPHKQALVLLPNNYRMLALERTRETLCGVLGLPLSSAAAAAATTLLPPLACFLLLLLLLIAALLLAPRL